MKAIHRRSNAESFRPFAPPFLKRLYPERFEEDDAVPYDAGISDTGRKRQLISAVTMSMGRVDCRLSYALTALSPIDRGVF
jgi:predicted NodU family carbamoyl transferase